MACEIYFNISKTAVELIVIGIMTACAVKALDSLKKENEEDPVPAINPFVG